MVYNVVLDRTTQQRILASLVSILVTGLPLIAALDTPRGYDMGERHQCSLTSVEQDVITSLMRRNTSCAFNMTIDSVLAT